MEGCAPKHGALLIFSGPFDDALVHDHAVIRAKCLALGREYLGGPARTAETKRPLLVVHGYKRRAIVDGAGVGPRRRIRMLAQSPSMVTTAVDATICTTLLSVRAVPPISGAILVAAAEADLFVWLASSRRHRALLPRIQDPVLLGARPVPVASSRKKIHIDCFGGVVGKSELRIIRRSDTSTRV